MDELDAIYEACAIARWPVELDGDHVNPADYWRALLVVVYNLGLRHSDFTNLRFSDLDVPRETLYLTIRKTRKRQGFHMVERVISHIERIRGARPMIFERDNHGRYGSRSQRYRWWDRIQREAKLAEPFFDFHDLRRTAGSVSYAISPAAAQDLLGHASLKTTKAHYVNPDAHRRDVAETIPQIQASYGNKARATIKIG